MPKFAASLVCPVDSPPRKNAVVEVGNDGVIISVSEGTDAFRESAGVEFYSGILIPGLSDLMSGTMDPHWQYSRGIRIAGTSVIPEGAGIAGNSHYSHVPGFKINEGPCVTVDPKDSPRKVSAGDIPDDRSDIHRIVTAGDRLDNRYDFSRTVSSGNLSDDRPELPRKGNYGYHLAADRYKWTGMYGELVDYVVFDGMDQFNRLFRAGGHEGLYRRLTGSSGFPVLATGGRTDMMGLLIELQEGPARISFPALLEMASLNGARAAGYEKTSGSLSAGKQPGLCIIEGADIANMRLLAGSSLRRLL
ncbi:MAG: hypothetical protein ACFCUM_06170 [Bacteroidales bacterium]